MNLKCPKCKQYKTISEFYVCKATGKPNGYCKECKRAYNAERMRKYRLKNKPIKTSDKPIIKPITCETCANWLYQGNGSWRCIAKECERKGKEDE